MEAAGFEGDAEVIGGGADFEAVQEIVGYAGFGWGQSVELTHDEGA